MAVRAAYTTDEDVKMLKWVTRNDEQGPLGVNVWRSYKTYYNSEHSEQSLNGRMRRNIVPNLEIYLDDLEPFEVVKVYKAFGNRLSGEQRRKIERHISSKKHQLSNKNNNNNTVKPRKPQKPSAIRLASSIKTPKQVATNRKVSPRRRRVVLAPDLDKETDETASRINTQRKFYTKSFEAKSTAYEISKARLTSQEEKQRKPFSLQTWNSDLKPVAAHGARSIFSWMRARMEMPNQDRQNVLDEAKCEAKAFFKKMFIDEEKQTKEEIIMISVKNFPDKKLRTKYFEDVGDTLATNSVNSHVYSSSLGYFMFFEYYIAKYVSFEKDITSYIELMSQLIGVVTSLVSL